jgi:hypothetical protein
MIVNLYSFGAKSISEIEKQLIASYFLICNWKYHRHSSCK